MKYSFPEPFAPLTSKCLSNAKVMKNANISRNTPPSHQQWKVYTFDDSICEMFWSVIQALMSCVFVKRIDSELQLAIFASKHSWQKQRLSVVIISTAWFHWPWIPFSRIPHHERDIWLDILFAFARSAHRLSIWMGFWSQFSRDRISASHGGTAELHLDT